jgi:2,3-bisphosphoglycerate-independent phosphoglycerate mutase
MSGAGAPVVLVIRDGWGESPHRERDRWNAVRLARTPVADGLRREWPSTLIRTSGEDVGLPAGVMGNSEVGHQNIGAGRIVDQELMRITRAIRDGRLARNPALLGAFDHARRHGGRVHLLGLVSDGRVHSDLEHLLSLIDLAAARSWPAEDLLVHAITDGRDTAPRSGLGFLRRVEEHLRRAGVGRIASILGRYYAMDRDHRWPRTKLAYSCLSGRGGAAESAPPMAASAEEALAAHYRSPADPHRQGDEFLIPTAIRDPSGRTLPRIGDGDAVIFFNFRGDRPRQITRAFVLGDEAWAAVPQGGFARGPRLERLYFCTMTGYEADLPVSAVAFEKPPRMQGILGQVVADAGLRQLRCAETEKYAHVTFFFNDYREEPFPGEERLLVPSPTDVATYDQKPEMSARAVAAGVVQRIAGPAAPALVVVNFANPDMVGHTGNLAAVVRAVEVTDECTGRVLEAVSARGGAALVTADHGNAEEMWDVSANGPHTAHTTYDVPLHVVGAAWRGVTLARGGRLGDVAPTLLAMMGLAQPPQMTGRSLLPGSVAPAAPVAVRERAAD